MDVLGQAATNNQHTEQLEKPDRDIALGNNKRVIFSADSAGWLAGWLAGRPAGLLATR